MSDVNVEIHVGAEGARSGAKEANEAVEGILAKLKDFKTEAVSSGREARFFASQIAAIVPEASQAKAIITDLIAAAVSGGGIGAALEVTRLLVGVFRDLSTEAKRANAEITKAADDWAAHIKAVHDETEKLRLSLRGISAIELQAYAELEPLRERRRKQQAALSKAEGDLAEAEIRGAKVASTVATSRLAIMSAVTSGAHKAIAAAREDLRITNEKIAALEKEYALRQKVESKSPFEASVAEAQQRADQATIDSAVNLARIQTEQDVARDRELGKVRLTAEEKIQLAKEIADAQLRADEATEASEINKVRIYTQQERAQAAATKAAMDAARVATDFVRPIEHAFASSIRSMIESGKSFTDAMQAMLLGLANAVVDGFIKMAGQAVIAAIEGKSVAKVAAVGENEGNIAVAVSGAAASQAMIPFIGPELAMAAAAQMDAGLHAMTAPMFAFARGGIVPQDGPAFVHAGEMVLPPHISEALQDAASGGGMGGDVNVHIQAWDGADVMRVVSSDAFRRAVREARRNGLT